MSAVLVELADADDWNCCECDDEDSEPNEANVFVPAGADCWFEDLELGGGGNSMPIPPLDLGFCLAIELVSVFF